MRKTEWKRQWRRARCRARKQGGVAGLALTGRHDLWAHCAQLRAYWLGRPDAMRCHKLTLIADCRRALAAVSPRLP